MPPWKLRGLRLWAIAAPCPAIVLGALVMRASGVPVECWSQNLIVFGTCAVGYFMVVCRRKHRSFSRAAPFGTPVLMATTLILASTLLFPGEQGVHRWVLFGPI